MIHVAMFGAGRIGQLHAANLARHPRIRLVRIIDPNTANCQLVAVATGAAICSEDEALADPRIDGFIVASSTDTHARLVTAAVATGRPTFCEKPISLDLETARRCVESIERSGARFMLGFHRRYDANLRSVRERIRSGAVGSLYQVVISSRSWAPPTVEYVRVSGGLFRDQSIHDFDVARYLTGEEIRTVYATGACRIDPKIGEVGDIDAAMITMETVSGVLVQINNARFSAFGYDQRVECFGTSAVLMIGNPSADGVVQGRAEGLTTSPPLATFAERYAQAYRDEMTAFADLIEHGEEPLAGARDGLRAQELAEAATASRASGQRVSL